MIGFLMWAAATAAPATAAPAPVEVGSLGWLSGRWRTAGEGWTEEIWSSAEGGMMLGLSRTRGASGIKAWEFMRIAAGEGGAVSFHGSPGGAPPVAFALVRSGAGEAVFENPGHDYPQRIVYRLDGDALVATVSLLDGAGAMSWRFARQRQ